MKLTRISAAGVAILLCTAAATATAQGAPSARKTYTGRVLVYTKGLSLRIWDPVNGVHQIDSGVASGGSPSITRDGRFVAYAKNDSHGCYTIHVWDTQLRRQVRSFSGIATPGQCNSDVRISPDGKIIGRVPAGSRAGSAVDGDVEVLMPVIRDQPHPRRARRPPRHRPRDSALRRK